MIVFRLEGIKSCFETYCKKYIANAFNVTVLTSLRDMIPISTVILRV